MNRPLRPRIYVASLADYNDGVLHGIWVDATGPLDDVTEQIDAMLANSHTRGAEEYAIHDSEDFGPLRIDEYESLDRVVEIAHGVAHYGEAFAAWADHLGSSSWDELSDFDDHYVGTYERLTDYAEDLLVNFDIDPDPHAWAPELIASFVHFNLDAFAEHLRTMETILDGEGDTVHIFAS
jgi:antirestriction protein